MSQKDHNLRRIKIAKITKPHGLKGNFYILPFSDNLSSNLGEFYLEDGSSVYVESFSKHNNLLLVKTSSFSFLEEVEVLRDKILYIDYESATGDHLIDDLINCEVFFDDNFCGIVDCYYPQGISGFLNVKADNQKSFLVPCQNDFFLEINIVEKKIHLNSNLFTPVY